MTMRTLKSMFNPRSIAIIGQGNQDDDPAALLEHNLIDAGFKGPVLPVNPNRHAVAGVLAYRNVASLPGDPGTGDQHLAPGGKPGSRQRAGRQRDPGRAAARQRAAEWLPGRPDPEAGPAGGGQTLSAAHSGTGPVGHGGTRQRHQRHPQSHPPDPRFHQRGDPVFHYAARHHSLGKFEKYRFCPSGFSRRPGGCGLQRSARLSGPGSADPRYPPVPGERP